MAKYSKQGQGRRQKFIKIKFTVTHIASGTASCSEHPRELVHALGFD